MNILDIVWDLFFTFWWLYWLNGTLRHKIRTNFVWVSLFVFEIHFGFVTQIVWFGKLKLIRVWFIQRLKRSMFLLKRNRWEENQLFVIYVFQKFSVYSAQQQWGFIWFCYFTGSFRGNMGQFEFRWRLFHFNRIILIMHFVCIKICLDAISLPFLFLFLWIRIVIVEILIVIGGIKRVRKLKHCVFLGVIWLGWLYIFVRVGLKFFVIVHHAVFSRKSSWNFELFTECLIYVKTWIN